MPNYSIVLIEPKNECNVGFVARAMKNFELDELYIYGSFEIGREALACASHAKDLLKNARKLESLEELKVFDFVIGTTARISEKEHSKRFPIAPRELALRFKDVNARIAILFGREDAGLKEEELELCDFVISIPASKHYNSLNISHAACIIFYEIFIAKGKIKERRAALAEEKQALISRAEALLSTIGYPKFKKDVAIRILKRVIARSAISGREAHTLAGIFKEANDMILRIKKIKKRKR